jgi:tRNA(Ile)-lysidine synthase
MCLLEIMHKLSFQNNIKLVAVHYNHNWRGEESKNEQQRCEEFCKKRGIEFYTETAPENVKKTETHARELRYEFFERAMEKYQADALLTAHNFDDNAETILYRIIKGTGIVGLRGILPKRERFLRPLIDVTRKEIEDFCKEYSLSPNDDSSNKNTVYKRNMIRHEILPLLSKINPEIKKALVSLGKIAQSESDIVEEYIQTQSEGLYKKNKILTPKYLKLSDNLKQKIIYNYIYESEIDYDFSLIQNLTSFIEDCISQNKPSKYSLSKDRWLYVDSNIIEIISPVEKNNEVIKLSECGSYQFNNSTFTIQTISCHKLEGEFIPSKDEMTAFVEISDFEGLEIRTRKDGDVITPLGFSGTMKLKKYLMSKNIPQHRRDKLVLLCRGKEVLWVAGVGLSDKIKTRTESNYRLDIKYNDEDIL